LRVDKVIAVEMGCMHLFDPLCRPTSQK